MLTNFVQRNIAKAKFKKLRDGNYYSAIPGYKGVWASAITKEQCKKELQEVFEEWLVLKLRAGDSIPGLTVTFSASQFSKLAEEQYA